MRRREWLQLIGAGGIPWAPALRAQGRVEPGTALVFPRDFGAHPEHRTEWWYLTGELLTESPGKDPTSRLGFQITFFRSRNDLAGNNPSAFAPRQLLFAHVALTDLAAGRLLHDQRMARAGFGLAEAAEHDTRVRLHGWELQREGPVRGGRYRARLEARNFSLDLTFQETQPLLLQGQAGYSRKGPEPGQSSHYYSKPQLAVQGQVQRNGQSLSVRGTAWLDHEWSEALMHPEAVGWDWTGMNLDDGSALTAFRLRRNDGSPLWAGGSWRTPGGAAHSFGPGEVHFEPQRHWTSPASGATYPVQWQLRTPVGNHTVAALLDAQELDSRGSTGAIYWEGLSELRDAEGRRVGRGYLEMTGYAGVLRL